MPLRMNPNEPSAIHRRVYFHLVAPDGITPVTGEVGQPEVNVNGGAFGVANIGALVEISHGRYYATLSQAILVAVGDVIDPRYKSPNTAECPGSRVQVGYDPNQAPIGAGSVSHPVTVTEDDGVTPLEGVAVWVTTDVEGANRIAGALYTDTLGRINGSVGFLLDPGTYYLWRQLGGWDFANPVQFTVS